MKNGLSDTSGRNIHVNICLISLVSLSEGKPPFSHGFLIDLPCSYQFSHVFFMDVWLMGATENTGILTSRIARQVITAEDLSQEAGRLVTQKIIGKPEENGDLLGFM